MLNPESVILNLIQNLFRAGLFQHLIKSNKTDPEINSGQQNSIYNTVTMERGEKGDDYLNLLKK